MPGERELALLNIFVVETEEGRQHIVAFLDPVRAGAEGIPPRSVVGGFTPDESGSFDYDTFELNADFIEAFVDYMNSAPSATEEIRAQASLIRSDWLYVLDPRNQSPDDADPPKSDILGCYAIDDTGQVAPKSFQYNAEHLWFCLGNGVSGLLEDRDFFDWINR